VALEPALLRNTALHRFGIAKWPLAKVKHMFAARFRSRIDARGIAHPDAFFGTAHAGHIDLKLLRRFLTSSQRHRLVEVALHPGQPAEESSPEDQANGWFDPLAGSRPAELRMLISDELPRWLESAGWRLGRLQPVA
jgi:hypothetical protein